MTGSKERDREFSLHIDGGIVVVRWTPGVHITGPLAVEAMATINELNGEHKRPLLVDMSGTRQLTREARETLRRDCQVSRMAIVGSSAVHKVIADFVMRVTTLEIPSRYFTSGPARHGLASRRRDRTALTPCVSRPGSVARARRGTR